MRKLLALPLALALLGAGCSSSTDVSTQTPTAVVPPPAAVQPKPTPTPAPAPTPSPKPIQLPTQRPEPGYTQIFSFQGHGASTLNTPIFTTTGGKLKIVGTTMTDNPLGSASTFELKSDEGAAISNTVANAYTKTAGTVTGETTVQGVRAGKYHISVKSTVDWSVLVYQAK